MILFPFMTTWMWFQIFKALPFWLSYRAVEGTGNAETSWLPVPFEGS